MTNKRSSLTWPLYQALWFCLTPPLHLLYAWMALKQKSLSLYRQRLGFSIPSKPADLWIHAASVGEVSLAITLLEHIKPGHPGLSALISCNTPTAYRLLAERMPANSNYQLLPVDKVSLMKKWLDRVQPRCVVIVETEIWPNLFRLLGQRRIPLLIVNARASQKTLDAPDWIKRLYADCLSRVSYILARSKNDQLNFEKLGAVAGKIKILGNMKFHMPDTSPDHGPSVSPRPYILLASSHDDEELQLCQAILDLPGLPLLVIAPRHPQRAREICRQLASVPVSLAQRSKQQAITPDTQVYLADTLGELSNFIQHAQLVIMGGSFVPIGGHNILEVAALKKALLCGPHMQQFADETRLLSDAGALRQCRDYAELKQLLAEFLQNPEKTRQMGTAGYQCLQQQQHILGDYVAMIQPFIAASS